MVTDALRCVWLHFHQAKRGGAPLNVISQKWPVEHSMAKYAYVPCVDVEQTRAGRTVHILGSQGGVGSMSIGQVRGVDPAPREVFLDNVLGGTMFRMSPGDSAQPPNRAPPSPPSQDWLTPLFGGPSEVGRAAEDQGGEEEVLGGLGSHLGPPTAESCGQGTGSCGDERHCQAEATRSGGGGPTPLWVGHGEATC